MTILETIQARANKLGLQVSTRSTTYTSKDNWKLDWLQEGGKIRGWFATNGDVMRGTKGEIEAALCMLEVYLDRMGHI